MPSDRISIYLYKEQVVIITNALDKGEKIDVAEPFIQLKNSCYCI